MKRNCGRCHTCGSVLRAVLDGEQWCATCKEYRRYHSHGWSSHSGEDNPCPEHILTPAQREQLKVDAYDHEKPWIGETVRL